MIYSMVEFSFTARGHHNVLSTHRMTLEFTKETHLTPRGDCIVALGAEAGCADLPERLKEALKKDNAILTILIECGGVSDIVRAHGSSKLTFSHPTDMVVRKSGFVCGRTLALGADKAALDLDRNLIKKLSGGAVARVHLKVE